MSRTARCREHRFEACEMCAPVKPWRTDWYVFAGSPVPVTARYTTLSAAWNATMHAALDGFIARAAITRVREVRP